MVAPWGLFLVPLTLLLLLSRPRRFVEWWWLALGLLWTAAWWTAPGSLSDQAVKAWGALLAGSFLFLAVGRRRPAGEAALSAAVVSGAVFAVLLRATGLDFRALELATARDLWASYRDLIAAAASQGTAASATLVGFLSTVADTAGQMAQLAPAMLFLVGALGLGLAWRWYHRIAAEPVGAPMAPFEAFRFSDHLVWLMVAGLALALAQATGLLPTDGVAANLLVALGGLYVARGLAVIWPGVRRLTWPGRILALVAVVLLSVFVVTGLFGLGLADTWIDFRRRRLARAQGG